VEFTRREQAVMLPGFAAEPLRIGDGLRNADTNDRLVVAPFAFDARILPVAAALASEEFFPIAALGFLGELRATAGVPETPELSPRHVVPRQRDLGVEHHEFGTLCTIGEFVAEGKPWLADARREFDALARGGVVRVDLQGFFVRGLGRGLVPRRGGGL